MMNALKILALLVLPAMVLAAPVSTDEAKRAVATWVGFKSALGCQLGSSVADARTCATTNGVSFHVVRLAGGGFVVTSADTEIDPILAFSEADDLVESEENPLWTLLRRDLAVRGSRRRKTQLAPASAAVASAATAQGAAATKWARLLPAGATNGLARLSHAAIGKATVSDVRVAPLLKTKWNQSQDSYYSNRGEPCYNYYTPSNYPCGCVATAAAQIMRYHRFPTAAVTPGTYACRVEIGKDWIDDYYYYPVYADCNLTMQGGVYDWDSMPFVPADGTTLAQRQAIGKLTSDVGIACLMAYCEGGSGTADYMLARCLPERFGYASAVAACSDGITSSVVRKTLVSNLDAKLPVVLGLENATSRHAAVADGYGYSLSTFYAHINLGFAGNDDAWYAPPDIDEYSVIDSMVYNIYPEGVADGVICSGRVLSPSGAPIAGTTVCVSGAAAATTTTDASGIYAFILPPGSYLISSGTASQSVTLLANVATPVTDDGYYNILPTPEVNNVCDLDLTDSSERQSATTHTVTFDLGLHAYRTGGGALTQSVADGGAAVEPSFKVAEGWSFTGWSGSFTNVTGDLLIVAQYDVHAGVWTTDVDAVKEAKGCRLAVVLCANYGGCSWSRRAQPILESGAFLAWAASNGVYLVTSDDSHLPEGSQDAASAYRWFERLYSSITHSDEYVYYPTLAVAHPTNFNQAVGFDVVRDDGECTVGGLVYRGTAASLIAGLSTYLAEVTPDPTPDPTPVVTSALDTSVANVFDGALYDGEELSGIVQVKLAKAGKSGLSKLTATITPAGGKKTTASGTFDPASGTFAATAKDGTAIALVISADEISGTFGDYEIDGARNLYSSKVAADKLAVADADGWIGTYALAREAESGCDVLSVTVAKKGKVKVSGTLADGAKVSASAQMIVGAERCRVPVVYVKKGVSLAFTLWLGDDGLDVAGLDGAVFSRAGNIEGLAALSFDGEALEALLESDTTEVLTEYLPDGAEIQPSGSKWIAMPGEDGKALKAGKLVWDSKNGEVNAEKSKIEGYNVSGLKLTFTAKTGAFKGSFKVYTVVKGKLKSTTASVAGIVADGVGYGTATIKKAGTFGVRIE